ncbi:MAG: GAF and ANTAR domain-containing protein [Microthrixaceae bacterium]
MAGERRRRILKELSADEPGGLGTRRLCEVCAEVVGVTGAGIMLMSGDMPAGSVCTTDDVSHLVEDLQYTLGEGPCVDAHNLNRPVLEPDLASPATPRWIAFSPPAVEAGVRAIFGFPLQVGAARLGALNLYSDTPGPLTGEQHADAMVMAEIAAQAVLVLQAEAPPGELSGALESESDFQWVVHQASGMVSAQLEVSVAQAMVRLRAYAFGNDRTLSDVAQDVVARTLRFEGRDGEQDRSQ